MPTVRSLDEATPAGRLAAMAMRLAGGQPDDVDGVLAWLRALGCTVVRHEDGSIIVDGLTGMRVGFAPPMDPVTAAVQLGFAVAGMFWAHAYPGVLKAVNRQWAQQRKGGTR